MPSTDGKSTKKLAKGDFTGKLHKITLEEI